MARGRKKRGHEGGRLTEFAGEVADGFVAHGFTTERYLREVTLPAIERVLVDFGGQPHLGKWTRLRAHDLRRLHGDRFDRFDAVRRTQDPEGKFMNDALRALFDLDAGDAR